MTRLLETAYSPNAKIDKAAGIVRGVRVLGRESRNGRTYSDKAMNDAARLYEGAPVNIDHDRKEPHRERGLLEGFGELRNTANKGEFVEGDLHYPKSHPATPLFEEMAERFPNKIGLSHNADGKSRRDKGKEIVESIDRVISVDVVRSPATNKGLWESEGRAVKELLEALYPDTAKDSGLLEMDYAAQAQVNADPSAGADEQTLLALEAMVAAALRNNTLELPARIKQAIKMLNAFGSLAGGESGDDDPPENNKPNDNPFKEKLEGDGENPMAEKETKEKKETQQESASLTKINERLSLLESENAKLKKEGDARKLLSDAGLAEDAVLLESLVHAPDEAAQKRIIEREKEIAKSVRQPARSKPLVESRLNADDKTEYPKDVKSFAAALR